LRSVAFGKSTIGPLDLLVFWQFLYSGDARAPAVIQLIEVPYGSKPAPVNTIVAKLPAIQYSEDIMKLTPPF
jgi:hypothetical protein